MRSSTNVKVAGVCAGFAEYLDWDPTLVRLLWLLLTLAPVPLLPGVIVYVVCWIVMPVAPLPVDVAAAKAAAAGAQPPNVTHTPQAV